MANRDVDERSAVYESTMALGIDSRGTVAVTDRKRERFLTHAHTHTRAHAHTHARTHTHAHVRGTHMHTHACAHTHTHAHTLHVHRLLGKER